MALKDNNGNLSKNGNGLIHTILAGLGILVLFTILRYVFWGLVIFGAVR